MIKLKTEQILNAAAELFSRKGYHNTKMKDIADMAEVGKGTLYEYYRSKDELFKELVKVGARRYQQLTEQQLNKEGITLWDKLQAILEHQVDYVWDNKSFAFLLLGRESYIITESELYQFLYQTGEEIFKAMETVFQEAVDSRKIAPGNATVYAKIFYGIATEVVSSMVLWGNNKPSREEIKEIIYTLRFGLERKEL